MIRIQEIAENDQVKQLTIDAPTPTKLDGLMPITATPAALAGGVAATAGMAGAAAAGAAIGDAVD